MDIDCDGKLGIDPDPADGGTDGPVTYIFFTGDEALVDPIESHKVADAAGEVQGNELVTAP